MSEQGAENFQALNKVALMCDKLDICESQKDDESVAETQADEVTAVQELQKTLSSFLFNLSKEEANRNLSAHS